jgi:hypothetical protein
MLVTSSLMSYALKFGNSSIWRLVWAVTCYFKILNYTVARLSDTHSVAVAYPLIFVTLTAIPIIKFQEGECEGNDGRSAGIER